MTNVEHFTRAIYHLGTVVVNASRDYVTLQPRILHVSHFLGANCHLDFNIDSWRGSYSRGVLRWLIRGMIMIII